MIDPTLEFSSAQLKRLINKLEQLYPDTYPDHMLDPREVAYRAGQVSVVRHLKQELEKPHV
jgi:hypothetical protein